MSKKYNFLIVGCGGTGGNFTSMLGRYLYDNGVADHCAITLIDGDFVENKNIGRQPFLPCDIGRNKAEVMAEVLTEVFDIKCGYRLLILLFILPLKSHNENTRCWLYPLDGEGKY